MAFRPLNFDEGKCIHIPASAGGSSQTINKGDGLKISSGYYTPAASGDNTDVWFVAAETLLVTADGQLIKAIPTRDTLFEVDTSNTPTAAQQGLAVDLSAAGTIDTSAVTDQVFFFVSAKLPLSSKKAIGYFTLGVPNS